MNSLDQKINEMKENLINTDIRAIRKSKLKTIKDESIKIENRKLLEEYNYYVKILKKINKYISKKEDSINIFSVEHDRDEKIIYIITTINIKAISVGIPVEIKIITGGINATYMDCTYYENKEKASLYINNFNSINSNRGYGGILLKNLDNIIKEINKNLRNYDFKDIKIIEGSVVANKSIISEKDLKNMYIKYGFQIDSKNNMKRKIFI
jgi:hypothetical protein